MHPFTRGGTCVHARDATRRAITFQARLAKVDAPRSKLAAKRPQRQKERVINYDLWWKGGEAERSRGETGYGKLCGIMDIISFADDKVHGKRLA